MSNLIARLKWLDKAFQFIGLDGVPKITAKEKPDYLIGLFLLAGLILVFLAILLAFKMLLTSLFFGGTDSSGSISSLGLGALVVALLSAPFVIWRSWVAHQDYKVKEQGHITDRLNKAVEGLGAEKTVKQVGGEGTTCSEFTQPNLEVRIGSIYALERIAQDSLRDHIQIMEILCAYIRENAPRNESAYRKHAANEPRVDIQIAITVIGRRRADQLVLERRLDYRLDLTKTNLQKVEFSNLDFSYANFSNARLEEVKFKHSILVDTNFSKSTLEYARLDYSKLNDAKFVGTKLLECKMRYVNLSDAILSYLSLEKVFLTGAKFWSTVFEEVDFEGVNIKDASFQEVFLEGADLTEVELGSTFGDGSVELLPDVERPQHWPKQKLGDQFDTAYKKWSDDQAPF